MVKLYMNVKIKQLRKRSHQRMENARYTPLTHPEQPISFQDLAKGMCYTPLTHPEQPISFQDLAQGMCYTPLTHPEQPISFQDLAQGMKFKY